MDNPNPKKEEPQKPAFVVALIVIFWMIVGLAGLCVTLGALSAIFG